MKKIAFILSLAVAATGAFGQAKPKTAKSPAGFVPAGYVVYETLKGDLNKDGEEDHVLLIKGTGKENIEDCEDCEGGKRDLNRRGIVIAFKKGDLYELALENRACFAPKDEHGGAYFAPELTVSIKKGNLFINYNHGKYGEYTYNFRYQNSDFELIGFDENSNRLSGEFIVIDKAVSINFLAKKMLTRKNREGAENDGKDAFKETWENFTLKKPVRLRGISEFDGFNAFHIVEGAINK